VARTIVDNISYISAIFENIAIFSAKKYIAEKISRYFWQKDISPRKYLDIFGKTIYRRENIAIFSVLKISPYFQNITIFSKYHDILKISAMFKNLKILFFMLADIC